MMAQGELFMRITLKALQYFLTAVEHESIARAAAQLNVVPSAVSVAIDQVEAEFSLKLVMRYPSKGIKPTATGQILLGKIRHLLEEYDNLLAEGADLSTALVGSLRIGYFARIAPAFIPDIIAPLIKNNAGVTLKCVECNNETAQAGLLNGDFDVVLFFAGNVKPGIATVPLMELSPHLLTGSDHPLAHRKSVRLAELGNHPLILLDLPLNREYYRAILDEAGVEPNIVATATTTEMIRSLVGAGVGCSILHMRPLINMSYAGDALVTIPIKPKVRSLRLVLGHLEGNPRRLVHAFVEQCRQYFQSNAARQLTVTG
jgi:DNA-binding transcriptional LysR family regulator